MTGAGAFQGVPELFLPLEVMFSLGTHHNGKASMAPLGEVVLQSPGGIQRNYTKKGKEEEGQVTGRQTAL